MANAAKVLVVDDEKLIRWTLREALTDLHHEVAEAADGQEALDKITADPPDVLLLDIRLPGVNGMDVLREVRNRYPAISVVMISANDTQEAAIEALKLGAVDYIRKPFQTENIRLLVNRLTEKLRLEREVNLYRDREQSRYRLENLVGVSPLSARIRELVDKLSKSDATNILVEGESGTGKGLVAKVIHYAGNRAAQPFMEVSCSALTETLVESELFGHEKGSFTDAKATKKGMFELADGGTIFLDEIGDMPLPSQAKLLRALEDRAFKRVGGVRDLKVDVRVLAATNRNLEEEVSRGTFRRDLFYRLAVLRIQIPPLRKRIEDIPDLCKAFLAHYNYEFRRHYERVAPDAISAMMGYRWPGNVRELRNVIERVMILDDKKEIHTDDLPLDLDVREVSGVKPNPFHIPPQGICMEDVEKNLIAKALETSGGNQTQAAKLLNLSRDTLRYRMKKYGFEP